VNYEVASLSELSEYHHAGKAVHKYYFKAEIINFLGLFSDILCHELAIRNRSHINKVYLCRLREKQSFVCVAATYTPQAQGY
jgi:hypothetical protein